MFRYWACQGGYPRLQRCPAMLVFDKDRRRCVTPPTEDCEVPTTSAPLPGEENFNDGSFNGNTGSGGRGICKTSLLAIKEPSQDPGVKYPHECMEFWLKQWFRTPSIWAGVHRVWSKVVAKLRDCPPGQHVNKVLAAKPQYCRAQHASLSNNF